jgi:hypothetical protein
MLRRVHGQQGRALRLVMDIRVWWELPVHLCKGFKKGVSAHAAAEGGAAGEE